MVQKLDFDWEQKEYFGLFYINGGAIDNPTHFVLDKLKQLCQAVDGINDRIERLESMAHYHTKEAELYHSQIIKPLNNVKKECDHSDIKLVLCCRENCVIPHVKKCQKCGTIE